MCCLRVWCICSCTLFVPFQGMPAMHQYRSSTDWGDWCPERWTEVAGTGHSQLHVCLCHCLFLSIGIARLTSELPLWNYRSQREQSMKCRTSCALRSEWKTQCFFSQQYGVYKTTFHGPSSTVGSIHVSHFVDGWNQPVYCMLACDRGKQFYTVKWSLPSPVWKKVPTSRRVPSRKSQYQSLIFN